MTRMLVYIAMVFSGAIPLAQEPPTAAPSAQVHISGTVCQCGKAAEALRSGAWWVRFEGPTPLAPKIVKANKGGVYETDLPFGVWTMILLGSPDDTTSYARPRHFQVSSSGRLVFDIYLRPPVACDVLGSPEERSKFCWAEEFFQLPSADGVPYEVDLFNLHQFWVPCPAVPSNSHHREFATYNLVSIEANAVGYHPSEKILEASGDVLMQDETGEHKVDSVRLFLQDGKVFPLPRIANKNRP